MKYVQMRTGKAINIIFCCIKLFISSTDSWGPRLCFHKNRAQLIKSDDQNHSNGGNGFFLYTIYAEQSNRLPAKSKKILYFPRA